MNEPTHPILFTDQDLRSLHDRLDVRTRAPEAHLPPGAQHLPTQERLGLGDRRRTENRKGARRPSPRRRAQAAGAPWRWGPARPIRDRRRDRAARLVEPHVLPQELGTAAQARCQDGAPAGPVHRLDREDGRQDDLGGQEPVRELRTDPPQRVGAVAH